MEQGVGWQGVGRYISLPGVTLVTGGYSSLLTLRPATPARGQSGSPGRGAPDRGGPG